MMTTGRLPTISESTAMGTTAAARPPVPIDTANEAAPGSSPNSAASCGNKGCGAYSNENEQIPAAATATVIRRAFTAPSAESRATTPTCSDGKRR